MRGVPANVSPIYRRVISEFAEGRRGGEELALDLGLAYTRSMLMRLALCVDVYSVTNGPYRYRYICIFFRRESCESSSVVNMVMLSLILIGIFEVH